MVVSAVLVSVYIHFKREGGEKDRSSSREERAEKGEEGESRRLQPKGIGKGTYRQAERKAFHWAKCQEKSEQDN